MTLADDYFEYTKKYTASHGNKTIVLMQVGSFFECYAILMEDGTYKGSLIQEFASLNDMAIARKSTCVDSNKDNIVMAGFNVAYLDKFIKKLLMNGYTIPVFVQDMQTKNTTRSLSCIYSPGTFFNKNDNLENDTTIGLTNNTICIWIHVNKSSNINKESLMYIGLSVIDIITGKLINFEYSHQFIDSPTAYDQLEKYISIYNPSEVIIITNNLIKNYIDLVINYTNIQCNTIHKIYLREPDDKIYLKVVKQIKPVKNVKDERNNEHNREFELLALNCEKQKYQEMIIDKVYGLGSYLEKNEFREYTFANQALCFLLDFVYKHNPSLLKEINFPVFENHTNSLILANHSLKQLNIINDERYNGKLSCVLNFLNNCITNAGKRKFNYELLHPINDINLLNSSYDVIEHIINSEFYKTIRENLYNVRDIEKIERKIIMKNINPRDFYTLYNNISKILELSNEIKNNSDNNHLYNYINSFINYDISQFCKDILEFINSKFKINKTNNIFIDKLYSYNINEIDFINNKYNPELNNLFKNSVDSRQQFHAISRFFSSLLSEYEKPKSKTYSKTYSNSNSNSSTKSNLKSNSNSKSKSKLNSNSDSNNDLDLDFKLDNELDNELYNDLESKSKLGLDFESNYDKYIKIHETPKNDPMFILTKRRAVILKELIEKLIKQNGNIYEISYISQYTSTEEILSIDLSTIEFKMHGNNQTNMIIFSPHINQIANNIQNSKDILIDAININYLNILKDFHHENSIQDEKITKLHILSKFIALIDVVHCKAYNSIKYNYCKPIIKEKDNNKSYIKFKKLRHCLIEHLNTKELYVTNDLDLSDKCNNILLYGTNAVGKSSFIKSIGISLILAQSGMYVPCSEFIYYPYDYLFTRILGNDNIFKGLSTFAVEMSELRTILKSATNNSIILGDELCSGTESTSALSIFVASLELLHKIKSTFLFATHFHEILEYNEIKELINMKVYHMSVVYDKKLNTLIYDRKIKEGPGNAMYGLEVCKSLDLPNEFIERANQIRNKYNLNESVLDLKETRYNAKKLKENICEKCLKNQSVDVHHLQYQQDANDGIINEEFNKNHKANLINICEECHNNIHKNNKKYRKIKTIDGYKLLEL